MKATFNPNNKTSFNTSHRKEGSAKKFQSYQIIDMDCHPYGDDYRRVNSVIDLRIYHTPRRVYACIWVKVDGNLIMGSGYAGGCGYHRESGAAQEAITNAGFTLDTDICGVGDNAICKALLAIAECNGVKNPALVESYQ